MNNLVIIFSTHRSNNHMQDTAISWAWPMPWSYGMPSSTSYWSAHQVFPKWCSQCAGYAWYFLPPSDPFPSAAHASGKIGRNESGTSGGQTMDLRWQDRFIRFWGRDYDVAALSLGKKNYLEVNWRQNTPDPRFDWVSKELFKGIMPRFLKEIGWAG